MVYPRTKVKQGVEGGKTYQLTNWSPFLFLQIDKKGTRITDHKRCNAQNDVFPYGTRFFAFVNNPQIWAEAPGVHKESMRVIRSNPRKQIESKWRGPLFVSFSGVSEKVVPPLYLFPYLFEAAFFTYEHNSSSVVENASSSQGISSNAKKRHFLLSKLTWTSSRSAIAS